MCVCLCMSFDDTEHVVIVLLSLLIANDLRKAYDP